MQPRPVGVLLLSVQLPPSFLAPAAQRVLLHAHAGLETALRVLVYCRYTGELLQWRDWVLRDESSLYMHPRHHVPAWDSSDGWQLLFPEPSSNTTEAESFSSIVDMAGAAPVAPPTPPSFTCR
ncbi:type IV conjugative transfer system coupling [Chlorella sorokiniana]|uniref:Type IV conjugative transfer system coupling n=1 Tax=Chlorella sorokiniana TaxID=3076 RepID=A0A2P6TE87_CHLSO|nr:type IV conjugative transfer system coupling [Chlorella sorokiniana]|eukprot:PRW20942.1 type IV conjugative transfer system coupling [Chlorella sorokiniana]